MQKAAVYLLGFACSIKKNSSWLFVFDLYSYKNNIIGNSESSWHFKREQKNENSLVNAENDNFNYKVGFFSSYFSFFSIQNIVDLHHQYINSFGKYKHYSQF